MGIYISGCLLSCLFTYFASKIHTKNKYLIFKSLFALLPLIYVAAVRYGVGMDYFAYKARFIAISHGRKIEEYEILYHKLNEIIAHFGGDFRWLFAITSIIILGLIGINIFRESPYPVMSVFLLVATTYYFSFMNGMRQMIACAILTYSLKFVWERKLLYFLAAVAIAAGFHETSWVFIIVYFIYDIKLTPIITIISTLFLVVFTPYISDILNKLMEMSKYGHYLDSIFADREQGYIALFISIMVAVFGYFFNNKTDKKYQLYLKMQVIAIWISILVPYVPLINRIKSYFGLHVIIFIPLVLNKIKDQATRYAAMWVIIILYSVYCIYNLVVHNTNNVLPYHTIFELKF